MPLLQILILAVGAMIGLATLRVVREHMGRTPLPAGRGRRLFVLAFVFLPPIALGALTQSGGSSGQLGGVASVPLYAIILAGLVTLMSLTAQVLQRVMVGRSRRLLMLALVGNEGDPDDLPFDPPVTTKLAESVAIVDRANAAFPRGPEFPAQVDRAGFRGAWDALDAATTVLEGRIHDDIRLGLGVAIAAKATARDARSRLDTLRGLAVAGGQAWATV
jgi:hypothetical protein